MYQVGEDEMKCRKKHHKAITILLNDVLVEDNHPNYGDDIPYDPRDDGKGYHLLRCQHVEYFN